jgi:hypothetical protein
MENLVTNETSKKLKYAGFPQPDFAVGQIWYNEGGIPYVIVGYRELDNTFKARRVDSYYSSSIHIGDKDDLSYAASVTDLIPKHFLLQRNDAEWLCYLPLKIGSSLCGSLWAVSDPNPAQAAAKAYLFKNKKKKRRII